LGSLLVRGGEVVAAVEDGWASRAPAASRQKLDEVLLKTGVAARWRSSPW